MYFKFTENMDNLFIHRELSSTIKESLKYFPVVTITGPRQSGKTTLIKTLFPEMGYYTLENPDTREFANSDPVRFLMQNDSMILDEVHNVPQLLSYIQGIVDENPSRKFILSGSSQFAVMNKVTQSLAGRSGVFELHPLSLSEISELTIQKSVDELIFDGFYPAIYANKNVPKFLYPSYIQTYLEKDVRNLLQIKDIMLFEKFIRLCAGRIGSIFNASELANEIGVAVNTIMSWLSVLQASYIIFLLPPYYSNTKKRLTKSPKLYFYDTGLACYLSQIYDSSQVERDKMRGHLFENLIIADAMKDAANRGEHKDFYFYRDSDGNEIDFMQQTRDGFKAYEIKSSMTYHADFEKALRKSDKWIKESVIEKAVIYTGSIENKTGDVKLLNFRNFRLKQKIGRQPD